MVPKMVCKPLIATVFGKVQMMIGSVGLNVHQAVLQMCWRPLSDITYDQVQEGKSGIWELPTEARLMQLMDETLRILDWLKPNTDGCQGLGEGILRCYTNSPKAFRDCHRNVLP